MDKPSRLTTDKYLTASHMNERYPLMVTKRAQYFQFNLLANDERTTHLKSWSYTVPAYV